MKKINCPSWNQDSFYDKFLLQVIEKPTIRCALLVLILTNKRLLRNMKLKSSLCCSDCETVEFKILRAVKRPHSKFPILDFRIVVLASSGLCLLEYNRIKPWKRKGAPFFKWENRKTWETTNQSVSSLWLRRSWGSLLETTLRHMENQRSDWWQPTWHH